MVEPGPMEQELESQCLGLVLVLVYPRQGRIQRIVFFGGASLGGGGLTYPHFQVSPRI